jgi:hypothetical protein
MTANGHDPDEVGERFADTPDDGTWRPGGRGEDEAA